MDKVAIKTKEPRKSVNERKAEKLGWKLIYYHTKFVDPVVKVRTGNPAIDRPANLGVATVCLSEASVRALLGGPRNRR